MVLIVWAIHFEPETLRLTDYQKVELNQQANANGHYGTLRERPAPVHL